jgi:hypothetical protein
MCRRQYSETHLFDMICENFGDCQAVACVLPRNVSQGRDLDARVHGQIFQRLPIVIGDVVSVVRHSFFFFFFLLGLGLARAWAINSNGGVRSTVGGTRNQQHEICEPKVSEHPSPLFSDAQSANSATRAIERKETIVTPPSSRPSGRIFATQILRTRLACLLSAAPQSPPVYPPETITCSARGGKCRRWDCKGLM